jgi:glycosyltransferase involved in cell wall biosynthesis
MQAGDREHAAGAAAPLAVCTIVSNNYLALAVVLAESYREQHPGARVFVCIVDRPHARVDYAALPFETVFVDALGIPGFDTLAFRYGVLELNTAVKPFVLEWLRDQRGLERVLYLDPDILVLGRLDGLAAALERGPLVLTPHITAPLDDERQPSERLVLMCGVYNLGFVGLRLDASTASFLRWWQQRLLRFCLHDVAHGLFVDQSWMDLAPCFLPDVQIAREPIYNVAYWNLGQRQPRPGPDGRYELDGRPLAFVHFSGLPFDDLERVSRYQDRVRLSERPELRPLFEDYRARVWAAGHAEHRHLPYAFGAFDDGRPVPDLARRVLQRVDPTGRRWPEPFRVGPDSFLAWLTQPLPFAGGYLNRLLLSLWEERADLAGRFPDVCGRDLGAFAEHLAQDTRHGLPFALLAGTGAAQPTHALSSPLLGASSDPGSSPLDRLDASAPGAMTPWLNEPLGRPGVRPIVTRFALHVHGLRWDVQQRYPDPLERDRAAFAYWFAVIGADELRAAAVLRAPVLASLSWRQRASIWLRRLRRARAERQVLQQARVALPAAPAPVAPTLAAGALDGLTGVNLVGHFDAQTGVGQIARGTLAALRAAHLPLALHALDRDPSLDVARGLIQPPEGLPFPVTLLHANADETPRALRLLPLATRAGGRCVGYWFWELAHFPLTFSSAFEGLDEVWVPSHFVEQAVRALAPVPVRLVPPHVPPPDPGGDAAALLDERRQWRQRWDIDARAFVFLFAFDPRSVVARKNPEAVVAAFARVHARAQRPLALVIALGAEAPECVARLRELARGLPVVIEPPGVRAVYEARLRACDAYVALHRSEGLGLPAIEATWLGKPVVATHYGGLCDWLDATSGYPVSFRSSALSEAQPPYPRGAVWAEPDLDDAAAALQALLDDPEQAERRVRVAQARVTALYGLEASAERFGHALRALVAVAASPDSQSG